MTKPRLLDLFCGAGGAGMGYARAGFDVVGVDIAPQPRYPFEFHRADALEVLRGDLADVTLSDAVDWQQFHAIHASPPCQDYSRALRHMAAPQPRLIEPIRKLLASSGLPWVIENVPGAPILTQPGLFGGYGVELCGTMFGLPIERHRLFESNVPLTAPTTGRCSMQLAMNPHNQAGRDRIYAEFGRQNPDPIWNEAMGVGWMTKHEGREAIPPAYTEWIGAQLLAAVPVAA